MNTLVHLTSNCQSQRNLMVSLWLLKNFFLLCSHTSEFNKLKANDQLFAFPAFFTGKAYIWYQSRDDNTKNNLNGLKNAFKSKYIDTNEIFLEMSFFAIKQGSNQSLEDYVNEIEKHLNIGDLPNFA